MKETVLKYVLKNAHDFGKVKQGVVLGLIVKENPELKKDMPSLVKEIGIAIKEVEGLRKEEIEARLKKFSNFLEEKKEEKREGLKELEKVDYRIGVIMRFAPSPSGPMHIGHAFTGGLTSLYVKKYGGKFILRIEDTNSDNIDSDAYEMLPQDADWIFGNVTEVWIQSDRMKTYYDYVLKMLNLGVVYVCTCSQEQFKKYSENKEDCSCRGNTAKENMIRWNKMFDKVNGFKEGEAVVRFKSNMQDKNPAMRDFPLVRINDSEHPRQKFKYRVWPLMNLCVTVDDIEAGMTHIIRAKDHADNAKRQEMMYGALGLQKKFPQTYFLGRYNFEGMEISCSKTKMKINQGLFTGWDDIRIPFLAALKRRGYQPEAFLKYTELTGLSPVDKTIPQEEFWKSVNAFNREIIEPKANRYFFIDEPVKVKIEGALEKEVEFDLHPSFPQRGKRKFLVSGGVYLTKRDIENCTGHVTEMCSSNLVNCISKDHINHAVYYKKDLQEGKIHRLMEYCNFKIEEGKFKFVSEAYEDFKEAKNKGLIIHWLPVTADLEVEVLMNDGSKMFGWGEDTLREVQVGEIVQLERRFFARLDRVEKGKLFFWYLHK